MAIKSIQGKRSVLDAARQRIINVFANDCKVYLAFSAGKDSLCLSHLVYDLAMKGEIKTDKLTVFFIDEETIYPSMEQMALRWRKRFISIGATFLWYCLPVRQVCMLDQLQNRESWITWDPEKKDVWVRQPPPFAITRHPALHYAGEMNYQTFCERTTMDGLRIMGVRTAESIMRLKYISKMNFQNGKMPTNRTFYPIYDWKDNDVWLYIKENNLDFPECYMHLYQLGVKKNMLRLCTYFGDCSTQGLRWVSQNDPELWAKIEKREPNAYLAMLYWDSEMFGRSTKKRRELESEQTRKDYRALIKEMLFEHPEKYFNNQETMDVAMKYREFYVKSDYMMTDRILKKMYEALIYGDPKQRTLRALYTEAYVDYMKDNER